MIKEAGSEARVRNHLSPGGSRGRYRRRLELGKLQLDLTAESATDLMSRGGLFAIEHPFLASSWSHPSFAALHRLPSVRAAVFDQCRFDLVSPAGTPMRKRTKILTNCRAIFQLFDGKLCQCTVPHRRISGSELGIGVSQHSQRYPERMIAALVEGFAVDSDLELVAS